MNRYLLKWQFFCLVTLITAGCSSNQPAVITNLTPTAEATVAVHTAAPKQSASTEMHLRSFKPVNALAAIVNDDIITSYDVKRETEALLAEKQKTAKLDDGMRKQMQKDALEMLIEKTLVRQKIRELNIKVSEDDVKQAIDDVKKQNNMTQQALVSALAGQGITFEQYRTQILEQLERVRLISMEVRSNVLVSESEIKAYYEANLAKYSEDDLYRARHIFFRIGEKTTAEEIKRNMSSALSVLADAKGGKDFIELAKKHSQDPAAAKDGGDMGSFKKGDMQPELEQAIAGLKPGEISELVYTPLGLHIIRLESITKGKPKPFANVKAEIQELLYRKKSEERFARWSAELREKASIEIKPPQS